MVHKINDQNLILLPEKAIFWQEKKTLILSDLHLGKSAHFRKNGIPTPPNMIDDDLDKLAKMISELEPVKIIYLGDLFHSKANIECEIYDKWRKKYTDIEMILVKGNHDRLGDEYYSEIGLEIVEDKLELEPFCFVHEPLRINTKQKLSSNFYVSGHIHPAIRMVGAGKQSITFPCFYFNDNQCIVPAFGNFTGRATIRPKVGDNVYIVADDKILKVS